MINQTHTDWEWVVVEDAPELETGKYLDCLFADSCRRVTFQRRHGNGSIGANKAHAASLCRGEILVELDHDDELLPNALELVASGFAMSPMVDFIYSDWIDVVDHGRAEILYPPGWAMGFGAYCWEIVFGERVPVALAPAITWETIRHIVSMPNHLRAWRASTYRKIGGHNPDFAVGDDYELLVRTFLEGRMCRIARPLYIQHHASSAVSASRVRNAEIQEVVRTVADVYERDLDKRCLTLGVIPHQYMPLTTAQPLHDAAFRVTRSLYESQRRLISLNLGEWLTDDALKRALEALLTYDDEDTEILVVGDARRRCYDVANSFEDERVRYWELSGVDEGGTANRQYAAKAMARGDITIDLQWSQLRDAAAAPTDIINGVRRRVVAATSPPQF